MNHDDIRQRLAAVERIDWSKTKREQWDREVYGTFVDVGPVTMLGADRHDPPAEHAQEAAIVAFLQNAAADLRRLLADLDHATTTRGAIMPTTNPVYGPPPDPERGEPTRYLADAVEVQRPNGDVVRMDLVALADAAINADRAVAELRKENAELRRKVAALEERADNPRSALTRAADAVEARLNQLERDLEEVERQRGRRDG
ncbi:hypothetical protein AB0I81_22810 [Nonomuraea sp. NPDC050404]|uniref:hypothetical protein n=1 Tax=Nonomuraea sp. NPDC050404 TaxID=3155783 RepID=UPI0033F04875